MKRRRYGRLPRVTIATADERAAYAAQRPRPVYPLHGFIALDGQRCPVEDLRGSWSKPDPVWEVMAPAGFHFRDYGTHSLLGLTLGDAVGRAASDFLVPCTVECGR